MHLWHRIRHRNTHLWAHDWSIWPTCLFRSRLCSVRQVANLRVCIGLLFYFEAKYSLFRWHVFQVAGTTLPFPKLNISYVFVFFRGTLNYQSEWKTTRLRDLKWSPLQMLNVIGMKGPFSSYGHKLEVDGHHSNERCVAGVTNACFRSILLKRLKLRHCLCFLHAWLRFWQFGPVQHRQYLQIPFLLKVPAKAGSLCLVLRLLRSSVVAQSCSSREGEAFPQSEDFEDVRLSFERSLQFVVQTAAWPP